MTSHVEVNAEVVTIPGEPTADLGAGNIGIAEKEGERRKGELTRKGEGNCRGRRI